MEEEHIELLRKNWMPLVSGIHFESVSTYLQKKEVLSSDDIELISSLPTTSKKNEKLLDVIMRKRGSFIHFIEALDDGGLKSLSALFKLDDSPDGSVPVHFDEAPPITVRPQISDTILGTTEGDMSDGKPLGGEVSVEKPEVEKLEQNNNDKMEQKQEQEDGRISLLSGSKKSKLAEFPSHVHMDIQSSLLHDDIYRMDTIPRGYCVIINNKDFEPSSGMERYPRKGTDVDANMAEDLFNELGFIVEKHRNQTVYQMRQILKRASGANFDKLSAFTCIILSHGQEGVVYGIDGTLDIRELAGYFRGRNLAGKPKMFFFQACQGSEYMDSVEPDIGVMETDGPSYGNDISLPTEADFIYAYSTVPGYYSWRNSISGSWFMQAIVEVFRENAHKMDVARMLTRVNRIVSTKKSQTGQRLSHNKRQISSIVSQLRKDLFLYPPKGPLKSL